MVTAVQRRKWPDATESVNAQLAGIAEHPPGWRLFWWFWNISCSHVMISFMRTCKRCGVKLAQLSKRLTCDDCHRKQVYECRDSRKQADPEGYQEAVFNNRLWTQYRLRRDQYDILLASQDGVCAGCSGPNTDKRGWQVDHDHSCCSGIKSCGKCVRGILCRACNTVLGQVQDDITRLVALANYLALHQV